jgi:hypothetical protein
MHTTKSSKAKKSYCIFMQQRKLQKKKKKYGLACILTLITSLLKSRELDQYLKKIQKYIFFFVLVPGITNLYVKTYSRY